jgi:hypothetical protein
MDFDSQPPHSDQKAYCGLTLFDPGDPGVELKLGKVSGVL